MLAQDADGYSADRKETEESTEPEEEQKQKNSRWEKEPENVEMKLWAVGKDQAETGSLKDLLDGSDEELEEWKDWPFSCIICHSVVRCAHEKYR